ncbi:uncharacterized protein GLRG_00564 [Colletotrichum graminicola M1.001]|uniref:Uncharacterized protein n=1 Tax=Colletotrichum graminicola (strain M1.001 / M2 / FGSC 10212) TaxID=645133 RepID=E3Q4A8_COLGM|nr:uncharacterized protein GLRG_00564 [Colletotrichum graminicola M1.001]EFQ25420.1 hypothetical protein GLRG_00564 [Colletotrichum graminicola M1.001]
MRFMLETKQNESGEATAYSIHQPANKPEQTRSWAKGAINQPSTHPCFFLQFSVVQRGLFRQPPRTPECPSLRLPTRLGTSAWRRRRVPAASQNQENTWAADEPRQPS